MTSDGLALATGPERVDTGRHAGATIVVTGAGSGLGRATALRLHREGATVVALDRDERGLVETQTAASGGPSDRVAMSPPALIVSVVDVGDSVSIRNTMSAVFEVHPAIDALVNVAGVMDGHLPVHELDDETWERVMSINAGGTMRTMRSVLPRMLDAGGGVIVNVASLSGLRGGFGGPAYTASKHAVVGLTRAVAWGYADRGVRCNVVCPGAMRTALDATPRTMFGRERAALVGALKVDQPEPDDIAALISWLTSREARHINGAVVTADGGWSAA